MKSAPVVLTAVFLSLAAHGVARGETAIGAVFGYPGNVGLSIRADRVPINIAWSNNFIHGTVDSWVIKKPLGNGEPRLMWYLGPGVDVGIPTDSTHDFFLAGRVPIGLQFMLTPKIETFGEVAAGLQVLHDVDFYWASNIGIRFVLGK